MSNLLRQRWLGLLLFLCSVMAPVPALASDALVLRGQTQGVSLLPYTGYWIDPTGQSTLQDARAAFTTGQFQFTGQPLHRGGSDAAVWFVLRFKQTDFNGDWVLATPFASVSDLRFFGPFDQDGVEWAEPVFTGSTQPYATRPLDNETFVMRAVLGTPGEYTVFVRAVSNISRSYEFKLWDISSFYAQGQAKRVFDGLCYGIVVGMLAYNLVLFLVFRDRNYLLYLLSGFAALLTIVSFNGHIAHYMLPNAPQLTDRLNTVLPAVWIATGSWFAYEFLALRQYAPRTGKAVLLTAWVATATALLAAWGMTGLGQALNENVSLLGTLVVAWGAISAWRQGYLPARLYLLGQVALFSAVFIQVSINWGWLDWPFMYDNGMQAGVAIEVMVFATALSSRLRAMYAVQAELIRKTEHLTVASETDHLTGVCNRAGLARRAHELLINNRQRTLVMIDLDKFKPINDAYGHAAGDAMLVEIAARLRQQVRPTDVVARLGGDEFAILFSEPNDRDTTELICKRLLQAMGQPLLFEGQSLVVGGSIGVARYPADGGSLEDLVQDADVAMYHVKKNGRAGYAFYEDLDAQQAELAARSLAESEAQKESALSFDI